MQAFNQPALQTQPFRTKHSQQEQIKILKEIEDGKDSANSATLQVATTRQDGFFLNKQLQSFGRQDFHVGCQEGNPLYTAGTRNTLQIALFTIKISQPFP